MHVGMCMCVNSLKSGVCYILGGYEDGTIVLWDERNPRTELHACQLFSDPGTYVCMYIIMCRRFECTVWWTIVLVLCMAVDDKRGIAGSVGTAIHSFTISLEKVH